MKTRNKKSIEQIILDWHIAYIKWCCRYIAKEERKPPYYLSGIPQNMISHWNWIHEILVNALIEGTIPYTRDLCRYLPNRIKHRKISSGREITYIFHITE
jgi:hypothetical protein